MTTVLVTGTGAVIGYGILRCLQDLQGVRTIAADIYPHAVGQHFANAFYQAPPTHHANYANWLQDLIYREKIDFIIPGIEQDVSWLASKVGTSQAPTAKLCLNNPDIVKLCSDKIAFDQFLLETNDSARILSMHQGSFATLAAELGTPFLLKPRAGYAGKGIVRVLLESDFAPYADKLGIEYLAQRIVGSDEQEYTVSAFCVCGQVRAFIALRRLLSAEGATAWAETVSIEPFLPALQRISERLGAEGPTNFQFRMVDGKPMLLEINPRISSATSIRMAFGFNEAVMSIDHFIFGKTISQPKLRSGSAVRYLADVVVT